MIPVILEAAKDLVLPMILSMLASKAVSSGAKAMAKSSAKKKLIAEGAKDVMAAGKAESAAKRWKNVARGKGALGVTAHGAASTVPWILPTLMRGGESGSGLFNSAADQNTIESQLGMRMNQDMSMRDSQSSGMFNDLAQSFGSASLNKEPNDLAANIMGEDLAQAQSLAFKPRPSIYDMMQIINEG